jgi:hypothetical protein
VLTIPRLPRPTQAAAQRKRGAAPSGPARDDSVL